MNYNGYSLVFSEVDLGYRAKGLGGRVHIVFKELSLEVPRGQVATLIGGNGSGKSTIIRGAAGLIHPYKGSISINQSSPSRCRIAYLPQTGAVFPWRKAIVDASTFLGIAGVSRWRRLLSAARIMRHFGFDAPYRQRNHQLSGGQKQMVAISRCLAAAKMVDLLLMDEPTNFLDKESRDIFIQKLPPFLKGLNCPVLIATHDRGLSDALAGQKLFIGGGEVKKA